MMKTHTIFDAPLFALGYKIFFALAGLSALALLVTWSAIFKGELTQASYFPPGYWHAHEMLMGYSVAMMTGFLLLAVKNWTGVETVTGKQLAKLALLWLYGRFVPFYEGYLPDFLIALIDFAFLPVLAYLVSKPILKAKQHNNLIFVVLLLFLAVGNGLIHSEILGLLKNTASSGIQTIMATLVVLVLIIAGRILPALTHRGISAVLIIRNQQVDLVAIVSAVLVFDVQILGGSGFFLFLLALVAALANLVRGYEWHVQKIWYAPMLWILYSGYGWLIVGFFLTALTAFSLVPASAANHAYMLGSMGIMGVGMMSRLSLHETGRATQPSRTLVTVFILVNLAALFRVLLPIVVPAAWVGGFIYVAMLFWLLAFSLLCVEFFPVLFLARTNSSK